MRTAASDEVLTGENKSEIFVKTKIFFFCNEGCCVWIDLETTDVADFTFRLPKIM